METPTHAHDVNHHSEENESLWYIYFGETGTSVVTFLYVMLLLVVIFVFLRWG